MTLPIRGHFRLTVTHDGITAHSRRVPHDADAERVNQARLEAIRRWELRAQRKLPASHLAHMEVRVANAD